MLKYIKEFANHTTYQSAESNLDKPNVSLCVQEDELHYNPWVETRLIAKFSVTSTDLPLSIINSSATSQFSLIEIDGVVQPTVVDSYTFNTTGEHTVKYTLSNSTSIGASSFKFCSYLKEIIIPDGVTTIGTETFANCVYLDTIIIPNSVTTIGQSAFYYCNHLNNIVIPSSVTNINALAFRACGGLSSVIVEATTPPTLGSSVFFDALSSMIIYVPSESVDTYKAASGWSNYADKIQAIPLN